jgi:hypothetical protein
MKYIILKQYIPIDTEQGDPFWAQRQIWVEKLNSDDTVDEFNTIEEAEIKKTQLELSDPSGRIYKIVEI